MMAFLQIASRTCKKKITEIFRKKNLPGLSGGGRKLKRKTLIKKRRSKRRTLTKKRRSKRRTLAKKRRSKRRTLAKKRRSKRRI